MSILSILVFKSFNFVKCCCVPTIRNSHFLMLRLDLLCQSTHLDTSRYSLIFLSKSGVYCDAHDKAVSSAYM